MTRIAFITIALILAFVSTFKASAGLTKIDFTGEFNEVNIESTDGLPAGDFDSHGGLENIGLFQLVEGLNDIYGSIFSPQDSSDVFAIEILEGFKLVGASINWATNLPSNPLDFNNPAGYLGQNTFGESAPDWFVEESSIEPEVFTINNLEAGRIGWNFDITPSTYVADSFSREQGIYTSLLSAAGSCAQSYSPASGGIGLIATCTDSLDYKMTFMVERIAPINDVPEPSTLAIFALGFIGLASRKIKPK